LLHRLIAETFIPNPKGKLLVNHKNGNKLDYRIKNLEWATHSENTLHAYEKGLICRHTKKTFGFNSRRAFPNFTKVPVYNPIKYFTECKQLDNFSLIRLKCT